MREVVPPKIITVKTTTTSTVALRARALGPPRPAARATPTAPRSPAQKIMIFQFVGISSATSIPRLRARYRMNQLMALLRGNTAHHLATQMPTVVTRMKSGLYSSVVSVKRERPR